jgi:hypothetical protein
VEGLFKATSSHVLKILKENKSTLMAELGIFASVPTKIWVQLTLSRIKPFESL